MIFFSFQKKKVQHVVAGNMQLVVIGNPNPEDPMQSRMLCMVVCCHTMFQRGDFVVVKGANIVEIEP